MSFRVLLTDRWFKYILDDHSQKKSAGYLKQLTRNSHFSFKIADREILGIVPFVTSHLMRRFFVFFTVAFLLFLVPAGGSNPAGPIT